MLQNVGQGFAEQLGSRAVHGSEIAEVDHVLVLGDHRQEPFGDNPLGVAAEHDDVRRCGESPEAEVVAQVLLVVECKSIAVVGSFSLGQIAVR